MAQIVTILLAVTAWMSLFSLPAERVLFRPDTYRLAISSLQTEDWMLDTLVEVSQGSAAQNESPMVESDLLRQEMSRLLPVGWAEDQLNSLVGQALAFVNFEQESLTLMLDLSVVKEALTSHSREIAAAVMESWPQCSAEMLLQMGIDALSSSLTELPYCKPPDFLLPVVEQMASAAVQASASLLPERLNLAAFVGWDQEPGWFAAYRIIRQAFQWGPPLFFFLLALLALLTFRRPVVLSHQTGQALFAAGVVSLILGVVIALFLVNLAGGFDAVSAALSAGASNLPRALISRVLLRWLISHSIWALLAILLGFALTMSPMLLAGRRPVIR